MRKLGTRNHVLAFVLAAAVAPLSAIRADEPALKVPDAVLEKFTTRDRDGNKRLSFDEFKALMAPAEVAVALRDFKLFDRDADGQLSLAEFWSLPTHPIELRGPLPDPLTAVVDQFVAILDQLFDNWDQDAKRTVPVAEFLQAFSKTLDEPVTIPMQQQADPDRDRQVTREEARRFVEIHAGMRRADGKLIREPCGRVCQHMHFQNADMNRDGRVSRPEFLERGYSGEKAAEIFTTNDLDKDGILSWEEWCRFRMNDPILDFRWVDANLDGQLDPAELFARTPDWMMISAKVAFPAFDTDRSGTLSLDEYRLTIQSNPVAMWHEVLTDPLADGVLSRAEFVFNFDRAVPVLRYVYFGLLDRNGDGVLDPEEFPFKTRKKCEIFALNADGSSLKKLFGVSGFPSLGSPAVSPDGKRIAFDGHGPNKELAEQTLLITDFEGGHLVNLGLGMMPTWSKDGHQLSYSRGGIRVIDAEGKESQQLANGWGAQWSPDGKRIAYYSGLTIMTIDPVTQKSVRVYNAQAAGYRQIFWNMTWSPDSQRLCFKGLKANDVEEVATVFVDPDQPRLKVHHSGKNVAADFAWHPHGDRIVFCMYAPELTRHQLYEFNPNKDDPIRLVKGQDPKASNTSACWTPDGKQLLVVSGDY